MDNPKIDTNGINLGIGMDYYIGRMVRLVLSIIVVLIGGIGMDYYIGRMVQLWNFPLVLGDGLNMVSCIVVMDLLLLINMVGNFGICMVWNIARKNITC